MQDPKCNFIQNFESDQRQAFRKMAIDMVSDLSLLLESIVYCTWVRYILLQCVFAKSTSLSGVFQ